MFNNLLNKGKCAIGFHKGDWAYVAEDSCTLRQVCERCGNEAEKIEHTWGEWTYAQDGDCTLTRECARCKSQETTVEHQWGDIHYKADTTCEQVQTCTRCQTEQPAGTVHQWDTWSYVDAEKCVQSATCSRCGEASQQTRVHHQWAAPVTSEFYDTQVTVCEHCGDMVFPQQNEHLTMREMEYSVEAVLKTMKSGEYTSILGSFHQHQQTLLQPVTDNYILLAADRVGLSNQTAIAPYGQLLTLLDEAREKGVDEAIKAEYAPTPPPPPAAPQTTYTPPPQPKPAPTPPPTEKKQGLDRQLIGHWRHTDSMAGGGFSMVTDTHLVLDGQGNAQRYSRTVSSFSDKQSGIERGKWTTDGNDLVVNFGRGQEHYTYEVHSDSLYFPNEGHFRLWTRV